MMRTRSAEAEWMDDTAATLPQFDSALADLRRINRMSLAYAPTLRWLDGLVERTNVARLSILDVGAGGGDMLQAIARWGSRRGISLDLHGLDRSPWAAAHAAARGVPARWITADLFALDAGERFDAVICSLFAHHLSDAEIVRFLRWLEARARLGWLVSDLHRHWLPWSVVWLAVRSLRMDPMVVHDSTISIARGFSRADWQRLVLEAGIRARIRWTFPFRWLVSRA